MTGGERDAIMSVLRDMRDDVQSVCTVNMRTGVIRYPTKRQHGYADALEDALMRVQDAMRAFEVTSNG